MPELPEVETIRRCLERHVLHRAIRTVTVLKASLRWPVRSEVLQEKAASCKIIAVRRRAKFLLLDLNNGHSLIMHLGMSGRLLLVPEDAGHQKHDHVIFSLDRAQELRYRDPRRFGMVDIWPTATLASHPRLQGLGFEPMEPSLTATRLHELARKRKKPLKNMLMDGRFLAGIGNIYANEALFAARMHPETPANQLREADWEELLHQIRRVLQRAIDQGGTTLNDFVNSTGDPGYFQLSLAVYDRTGEACLQCGAAIEKTVLAGRSTFYCPNCQPVSLQGTQPPSPAKQ